MKVLSEAGLSQVFTNVKTSFAAKNHNQASNTINALTGYEKAESASALSTSDTLNQALGKLEKMLDGKLGSGAVAKDSEKLGGVAASSYAKLASPAFTGTPTVPTAAAGTNTTQAASTAFVQTAVANLVNSAPEALDTLSELSAALGDDPNFATTIANQIGQKSDKGHTHVGTEVTLTGYAKASAVAAVAATDTVNAAIGKLEKALDSKSATNHTHTTANITALTGYVIADTAASIAATDSLNTALGKIQKSIDSKLNATATAADSSKLGGTAASSYAKLASPTFTGTPKAPTAAAATDTTQIATTAFVHDAIENDIVEFTAEEIVAIWNAA